MKGSDAADLFAAGLRAVDAGLLTARHVGRRDNRLSVTDHLGQRASYDLRKIKGIFIAAFGKAAYPMARAVERVLHDRILQRVIIVPRDRHLATDQPDIIAAGHPIPDRGGVRGARRIAKMLRAAGADDLVLLLISGGGSALCALPSRGITLQDLQRMNEILLASGADIEEINTIRRHLSRIKGGHMARLASPATTVALMISDVIGDRPHTIASGPAAPDPTTFHDARRILVRRRLMRRIPAAVRAHIDAGCRGAIPDTPKPDDPAFRGVQSFVIGNNLTALRAIARAAEQRGFASSILSSRVNADTRHAARVFAALIRDLCGRRRTRRAPQCIVAGGEMTSPVRGPGQGGRNQDFCLALAPMIAGIEGVEVLSADTDGIDGNTDAAGAIVNGATRNRIRALGFDIGRALARRDPYPLLKSSDSLLFTGATGTNVMDIQIVLIDRR